MPVILMRCIWCTAFWHSNGLLNFCSFAFVSFIYFLCVMQEFVAVYQWRVITKVNLIDKSLLIHLNSFIVYCQCVLFGIIWEEQGSSLFAFGWHIVWGSVPKSICMNSYKQNEIIFPSYFNSPPRSWHCVEMNVVHTFYSHVSLLIIFLFAVQHWERISVTQFLTSPVRWHAHNKNSFFQGSQVLYLGSQGVPIAFSLEWRWLLIPESGAPSVDCKLLHSCPHSANFTLIFMTA